MLPVAFEKDDVRGLSHLVSRSGWQERGLDLIVNETCRLVPYFSPGGTGKSGW